MNTAEKLFFIIDDHIKDRLTWSEWGHDIPIEKASIEAVELIFEFLRHHDSEIAAMLQQAEILLEQKPQWTRLAPEKRVELSRFLYSERDDLS